MRILILGGTSEAAELAGALHKRRHKVTTALAGRTQAPRKLPGRVMTGGFGGAEGLAETLNAERFDYLVDATHPFAATISANAVAASGKAGVPLLRLERPPWAEPAGGRWWHAADAAEAAETLPVGSTVLLTIGRQTLAPFLERHDCRFVVRAIEPPEMDLPHGFDLVLARPPFAVQDELTFLKHRGITHLVSKNSGGAQTRAKLEAAFVLKVQVVMIDRPALPPAETVPDVASALEVFDHLPVPERRSFFLPLLRRT